ncbi:MAG: RluA family pseudouridine synthase [Planctomycetota bacterium]
MPFPGKKNGPRDLSRPLERLELRCDERHDGLRLDQVLAALLHWRSRTSIRKLLQEGLVTLSDGRPVKAARRMSYGDEIVIDIPQPPEPVDVFPDDWEVPVVYEDRFLVAVDKPAGLTVHPSGRRVHGTLIHMLHKRFRRPDDPAHDVVPRLLHRLDRETSGVIAVGLDDRFHGEVRAQFEERTVRKVYLAVVHGRPSEDEGWIDYSIGPDRRSPIRLKQEARRDGTGQSARTRYQVLRSNDRFSLVELHPETGRTHQLRVHMDAIGCPLVGDKVYGVDAEIFLNALEDRLTDDQRSELVLDRHALHAAELHLFHPRREERLRLHAPLPSDMANLVPAGGD